MSEVSFQQFALVLHLLDGEGVQCDLHHDFLVGFLVEGTEHNQAIGATVHVTLEEETLQYQTTIELGRGDLSWGDLQQLAQQQPQPPHPTPHNNNKNRARVCRVTYLSLSRQRRRELQQLGTQL